MGSTSYIKWDAPGVEVVQPGEKELAHTLAARFNDLQKLTFQQTHHCLRATHIKTQGVVRGSFTVNDNLPEHLAQGMFAKPGKHECLMRYSSLPPKMVPDTDHAPRGLGIKVFDVPGEKLFGNANTQDFTFNNYSIIELRDAKGTMPIAEGFIRNYNNLAGFAAEQAAREDKWIASAPARIPPQAYMASMNQYSQGAHRFGDYVAKFAVFPKSEKQKDLAQVLIKETDPIDVLAVNLQEFHKSNTASFSFCAQLLENLNDQSVEDLGLIWDEDKYPFVEIATIEIPQQDSFDDAFRTYIDDSGVQCNPWHGLVTHQPLGSAQRSRRVVYAESRKMRLKMNGKKDYKEPESLAEVPVSA